MTWRNWLPLVLVALLAFGLARSFNEPTPTPVDWSELKRRIADGEVERVDIHIDHVAVHGKNDAGPPTRVTRLTQDAEFIALLDGAGVPYTAVEPSGCAEGLAIAPFLILPLALLGMSWLALRSASGGARSAAAFGRSSATMVPEAGTGVTFADVAGVEEAAEELQEIVSFLKTPEKFTALGGRPPKGVLLVGPPGTGKTLLARAVAGEAKVPFLSISGSAFVEMFVGVGAARVRDLFKTATEHAPCIIFVDELDAVGKARSSGPGANDEREQTLNQLLVEMDGFDNRMGIIVMAATNRPETLDSALMRPGRFDRQVLVDRPDVAGRQAILGVHARKLKLGPDVDLAELAKMTPGFAGADLANVLNEAALLAARRDREAVTRADVEEAIERVVAGLEKKSRRLSPTEKRTVAFHEVGHAICAAACPAADPVKKISIIPRGVAALGYTVLLPTEDRHLVSKAALLDRLTTLYGGRVAEEIVFGDVTTGAQDDIRRATDLARRMVTEFGMSRKMGPLSYVGEASTGPFDLRQGPPDPVATQIEREVREIVDLTYGRAFEILVRNRTLLEEMSVALIECEVLDGERMTSFLSRTSPAAALSDPPTSEVPRHA